VGALQNDADSAFLRDFLAVVEGRMAGMSPSSVRLFICLSYGNAHHVNMLLFVFIDPTPFYNGLMGEAEVFRGRAQQVRACVSLHHIISSYHNH
jgi:hypothetical protein